MTIARKIKDTLSESSWIRKMFEEGMRLKEEYGARKVYDFSLGNPNLQPPENFKKALRGAVNTSDVADHAYMPNAGYPHVRRSVADYLSTEQQAQVSEEEIIMTCGAAGALNVILKAILDPKDEVITPAPYFTEYSFYVDNHGGILKTVSTKPDFCLDIEAVSSAINRRTKAVLINSPNNPTGQIYNEESLKKLGVLLKHKGKELERVIYLISDEPYRKVVYDGIKVPGIFTCYSESIIAASYSKDISIPGERIGFIAINPKSAFKEDLSDSMTFANRILGFVNAPALMQRVIASTQGVSVDISGYAAKRDILCEGLADCGYEFIRPQGAFYLFPKTPVLDDIKFVRALRNELILVVPGSGFGCSGHFRIAYCVDDETIVNSIPGFKRAIKRFA